MSISQRNASINNCLNFETCKSCASNKNCSWSLNLQICDDQKKTNQNKKTSFSNLLLSNSSNCPLIEKKDKPFAVKHLKSNYEYQVIISNNSDFKKFLNKTLKSLLIQANTMNFPYSYPCNLSKSEIMVCNIDNLTSLNVGTYHVNLLINGTYLKYDKDKDYFFTIYDSQPSREDELCEPCIFRNSLYRYYIGCRLSKYQNKSFYDRQLIDRNAANINNTNSTSEINCTDIEIDSIKPEFGPSAGGTNVNITIRNAEKYLDSTIIYKVHIGEYECKNIQPVRNKTITCTTSPVKHGYVESYYNSVIVHYNDHLVLNSNRIIYTYERSEVTSVTPNWGFVNDSNLLTINGKYLNVGNTVNVTIGVNQILCNISENYLNCRTSCRNTNMTGKVNVKIDNTTITDDKRSFYFNCFEKPIVTPNLTLESIISGNTSLTIIGSHFSSMNKMYFNVIDHDKVKHSTNCTYKNDTVVVCKSPYLNSVNTNANGTILNFIISVKFHGVDYLVDLHNDFSKITLYPNPVITSFDVENDDTVIINGVDLDRGYEPVDVDLRNTSTMVLCNNIISRTRNFIKCKLTSSSQMILGSIHEIIVNIGNTSISVNKTAYDTNTVTTTTHQIKESFSTVSAEKTASTSNIEISVSELYVLLVISLCVSFVLLGLLLSCNINKRPNVKKLRTYDSVLYGNDIRDQPYVEPIPLQLLD